MAASTSRPSWIRPAVWIALVVLLGALAGGITARLVPHSYTATSQVLVSSAPRTIETLQKASDYQQQVVASYASVATTPLVLERVITRLGLDTTPARLAGQVSATVPADTALIGITASAPSAARAARIANAIGAELAAVAPSLTPTGGSAAPEQVTVVEQARAAAADDGLLFVGVGAAAGLIAALVVLWLRSGRPKPPRGSWRLVWQPRSPAEPA